MLELLISLAYLLVTCLVGGITVAVIYARWHYGTLERVKGLPAVVKPAFVGGSDVFVHKKIVHDEDTANVKKYGKIFGFYEGRIPHIYIADPELVRLIFVKDFDHFHNKRMFDAGHELINEMMDLLPYDKWKVVRTFISPTLTTGKIRNMSLGMLEAISEWMDTLKGRLASEQLFWPRRMFTALTTDVIARCGFGTRLNSLDDPDNIFVKQLKNLSQEDIDMNFFLPLLQTFPSAAKFIPFFTPGTLEFFNDILKNVMKSRREGNIRANDFVDCLNDMISNLESEEYRKLEITEITVMCQAMVFFLAGFETTASTLSNLTYNLSKNPDIQDKLVKELDNYLGRHNGKIEHETINELMYLTACIQETLRMFPPLIRIERVCNKDWYYEPTGLHIPKDMVIQVPVYAVHYNEEYFPDPHTFKPERFLPENKDQLNAYAFLSFGMGNHNCVGMRFAKEEMILAMANVMKKYTFKANPNTKITFRTGRTFLIATEPFSVDAIERH